ncbi:MAG: disulfide bond formation protein B [Candidatus Paceibacterota bacterium]
MQEHTAFDLAATHFLSGVTVAGAVFVAGLFLFVIYAIMNKKENNYFSCVAKNILPLGFALSLLGVVLSLVYSEVFHYAPCELCWYQRIFLYPQMFLFGYAWLRKDRAVIPYTLLLSVLGLVLAGYHHILQLGYNIYKPCSTAPFAVDCAKPSFVEYGFVTFPFMSFVLFGFLSVLMIMSVRFYQTKGK